MGLYRSQNHHMTGEEYDMKRQKRDVPEKQEQDLYRVLRYVKKMF